MKGLFIAIGVVVGIIIIWGLIWLYGQSLNNGIVAKDGLDDAG